VEALDLVDPLNKAGVMFREDLSADARFVFMGITSNKKAIFISRNRKEVMQQLLRQQDILCHIM